MLLGTKYPIKRALKIDQNTENKAIDMCYNTFWHTLTSTTKFIPGPTGGLFIFTGDIGDMWVRDSAAQVKKNIYLSILFIRIFVLLRKIELNDIKYKITLCKTYITIHIKEKKLYRVLIFIVISFNSNPSLD
jgi:meiotically up-regulated gene 157 (Mug157) protein